MHTPTVFDSNILDTFKELQLSDEKLHHLKNVLRIKDMDEIKISNGKGKIYFGNLEGNVVSLKSNQEFERKNDIDVFISFIQDKDRLRFIVEKLTELSVSSISFGPTDHSQKIKVDLVETVYKNEEKKLSYGASNSLIISQRKMQLLQTKQALIQKEYELYKSEVQLKTHTNPIQL